MEGATWELAVVDDRVCVLGVQVQRQRAANLLLEEVLEDKLEQIGRGGRQMELLKNLADRHAAKAKLRVKRRRVRAVKVGGIRPGCRSSVRAQDREAESTPVPDLTGRCVMVRRSIGQLCVGLG